MKINRSANVYCKLPEEVVDGHGSSEAKASISMNIVAPKSFEKRMQKFMDDQTDAFNKAFKKAIKKAIEKERGDD